MDTSSAAYQQARATYPQEIVGEHAYLDTLRHIAGAGEVLHACEAVLLKEDSNPHDNQAVVVLIEGAIVGYLKQSDAKRYREAIAADAAFGFRFPAIIVGGGRGRPNLGVYLKMPPLPPARRRRPSP